MTMRRLSIDRSNSEEGPALPRLARKASSSPAESGVKSLKDVRKSSDPLQDKSASRVATFFKPKRGQSKSAEPDTAARLEEELHLLRRASVSAREMEKELLELRESNAEMAQLLREQYAEIEALVADKAERDHLDEEHEAYKKLERNDSFLMRQRIAIACRAHAEETETRLLNTQEEFRRAQEQLRRMSMDQREVATRFQELTSQWSCSNRQCVACQMRPRTHACIPCGHFGVCGHCVSLGGNCTVCKTPVTGTLEVVFCE